MLMLYYLSCLSISAPMLVKSQGLGLLAVSQNALCFLLVLSLSFVNGYIPTTLEGPFKPFTAPLNFSILGDVTDLPDTDARLQRPDLDFQPEQISVSLSSNYDSVWISWVTGTLSFPSTSIFMLF